MALFGRWFPTIPTKSKLHRNVESRDRGRSPKITADQVRLLLFKECDWKGRKLLFDSSTIEKFPASKNDKPEIKPTYEAPYIVEISNGFAYVYKGPATDVAVLGEMIFGAVAINYRGVSFKIHIMEEPKRVMCTKVFCVPASRRISRVDRKPSAGANGSRPLNVPLSQGGVSLSQEGVSLSFSFDRGDSGFYGETSVHSSVSSTCDFFSMFDGCDGSTSLDDVYTFHSPPGRRLSASSAGSWQRRTFRSVSTRFDLGSHSGNLLAVPSAAQTSSSFDSQVYSNSSTSGTSDSLNSSVAQRTKNKLGLALLITGSDSEQTDLVRRCVEHSPQIQALVCRLRLATIAAGVGHGFIGTLLSATEDAARWLSDLMYGPRLEPLWLSLVSRAREANKLADNLLADICSVLSVADTKDTNFFISTLLTHVLTYHLGWVTTVSPYDVPDLKEFPDTTDRGRPYNALWAQLNDLCGSIGYPPRAARTIITGTNNAQLIARLLDVLTYFVRCGNVKRTDFQFQNCAVKPCRVVKVPDCKGGGLKRTSTQVKFEQTIPLVNSNRESSDSLVVSEVKRSATLGNLSVKLSSNDLAAMCDARPMTSQLKRNPTVLMSVKASSDSSLASTESEPEQKVVFVLGDNERLVGLKNKSKGGKSVKKSSKGNNELPSSEEAGEATKGNCDLVKRNTESPSKCCAQTLQHSMPKHSGFKFEFDKYPQIVTNYMKSKNLEILDRHYIGKPGNLKLDNFQFDPMVVPPIQEERCETCYKCQQMESLLQTPTNASELEFMNDIPRHIEPQYAREVMTDSAQISPKNFVRKRKENTVVVNVKKPLNLKCNNIKEECESGCKKERDVRTVGEKREKAIAVKEVVEFPLCSMDSVDAGLAVGFDASLLGGVTDHYVPDLVLQGTLAEFSVWEMELKRDLDLTSYLNKGVESPFQTVAIVGDVNTWEVKVVGRDAGGGGGMSALVGGMLDALPHMWRAKVPAHQCLSFLEGRLRELCVLSKALADVLMSTDFCDIATLTRALNIDVNDVPLLLAVATTHTPQVALRYGISFR